MPMILELVTLAVALIALTLSTWSLTTRSERAFQKWRRSVNEELETQERAFKRWRGELEEESENAKKRYRAAAKALSDSIKIRDEIDELGAAGEEAGDVSEVDARGSDQSRVQSVQAAVVAGGIWPGGRTG